MKWRLALAAMSLLLAGCATAQTTNTLSDVEIQGRQLARQILEQSPVTNFSQTGILKIRDEKKKNSELLLTYALVVSPTNWMSIYEVQSGGWDCTTNESLRITHAENNTNYYDHSLKVRSGMITPKISGGSLASIETMIPFAGSDFWLCDLGLEFFHWPEQKILKKEVRRSRGCTVLESTNPSANGYSRVVSWIDGETLGIVHAEAYDANGKLLKEFDPKSFKKVNGQWELQEMEIRNVQTGSRTRLEFDLEKK
jgi:hypothetical protein